MYNAQYSIGYKFKNKEIHFFGHKSPKLRECDVFIKNKKDLCRPLSLAGDGEIEVLCDWARCRKACDWSAGYQGALRLAEL